MNLDDRDFDRAVEELRALARAGASTGSLLELAKTTVAAHSTPIHAVVAFYRAFNIPLMVATSLGGWAGFSETNEGASSDDLEAEFGELLRSNIR